MDETPNIICTAPGGGPLPAGRTDLVVPLIRTRRSGGLRRSGAVSWFRQDNTVGEVIDWLVIR